MPLHKIVFWILVPLSIKKIVYHQLGSILINQPKYALLYKFMMTIHLKKHTQHY